MKSNTRIDRRLLAELVKDAEPKKLFDPDGLLASLTRDLAEFMLSHEAEHQLQEDGDPDNCRNGYGEKTVSTDRHQLRIRVPRDRKGKFEPQLVAKHSHLMPLRSVDNSLQLHDADCPCLSLGGHGCQSPACCDTACCNTLLPGIAGSRNRGIAATVSKSPVSSGSAHVLCKVNACLCKHFRKRDAPYAEPSANIGDLDPAARK